MIKIITYLFIFLIFTSSALFLEKVNGQTKKVIITGKILNVPSGKKDVGFYIHRLGFSQEHINSQLDSLGNFSASFESYIPTDVWVLYRTNFLILTHPGDSIFLEFDGERQQRPDILKTVRFSGTSAKTNQDAAYFQELYYSNPVYNSFELVSNAQKNLNADEYLVFMDSLKQKRNEVYSKFVSDLSPNEETKIWALTFIDEKYYYDIAFYPRMHKLTNNLKNSDWNVPSGFTDILLNRLPINEELFISGFALSNFISQFNFNYNDRILTDSSLRKYKTVNGGIKAPSGKIDSMHIYGILAQVNDRLLSQMLLTEFFSQSLESNQIDFFEKYIDLITQNIREPYLIEPLIKQYHQLKDWNSNPRIASNAVLKYLENSSLKQIMDSIKFSNRGKVIYVDCWATWCGPCRATFPQSKILMNELDDKDVAFVFLCLDSQEKGWKATLTEFQLGGQHFFLNQKQSSDLRLTFDIAGIPYFFLIDQQGTIIEKGSYLEPANVKGKIVELLYK